MCLSHFKEFLYEAFKNKIDFVRVDFKDRDLFCLF